MARKPRVHFAGALYHVIARGNQRQDIFLDDRDFQTYLAYLSEYKSKFSFHLYAYALMRNHIHILLEVKETPLSKGMQILQFRYTRYFNKRYKKTGHLFQGRYRAILCDKDTYLFELIRYIHLNPVRAGIAESPEKYSWTGHLEYLGKNQRTLIDKTLVLSRFGKRLSLARRRYRQFVLEGLGEVHQEKYYRVKDQRYLGEDEFVEEVEKLSESQGIGYWDISMEDIVKKVGERLGIPWERMYSLTRERQGAYGRGVVGYLGRKLAV